MGVPRHYRNTLHVSLLGKDNQTYRGTLVLKNWTLRYPAPMLPATSSTPSAPLLEDPTGASYYVIAVVLVYGMSIVMLIASHIKRNHRKIEQDKQIRKYFQDFMVVKERSSRDAYRDLKKKIVQKINWENNNVYRSLSRALIPAVAVPLGRNLLTQTSQQEMDLLRRGRRQSSPAVSVSESMAIHSGNKKRRKGLGHLFNQSHLHQEAKFDRSIFENLTELEGVRKEVRARANSVAISTSSSFDISGFRNSEVESGSDIDNRSEDSHTTLPALTVRGPSPDLSTPLCRSPLPTIADTEDASNCCTDDEESSDKRKSSHNLHHDGESEREDVWLMSTNDNNTLVGPQIHLPKTHLQRRVHFSASTKRREGFHTSERGAIASVIGGRKIQPISSSPSKQEVPPLVRQKNVLYSDMESDEDGEQNSEDGVLEYPGSESEDIYDEDATLHKITCV